MPPFIQQFSSLPWAAILTAVVTIATGIHVAALALGQKWPVFLKVASVTGAVAIDVQKIAGLIGGAPAYTSIAAKKAGKAMVDDPAAASARTGSTVTIVFLVLGFVVGCAGMTAKSIVTEACTVIDSGNPVIGALCLTAEEIASLFGHVKASRAYRASHPAASPNEPVDVCVGEVKP